MLTFAADGVGVGLGDSDGGNVGTIPDGLSDSSFEGISEGDGEGAGESVGPLVRGSEGSSILSLVGVASVEITATGGKADGELLPAGASATRPEGAATGESVGASALYEGENTGDEGVV